MLLYVVSVAVLEDQPKSDLPGPMQIWYTDNFFVTASVRSTRPLIQRLGELGPSWGVLPDADKSQYVCLEKFM